MDDVDLIADAGRLRAFLAVVDLGGFSRAADRLGVSQPTVSALVAALERRVGTPLLVRARSGARPTAAGAALVPHAERLLAVAEEGVRAVDGAVSAGRRRLAVAGGEALVTHLLPPALAAVRARLPRVAVSVRALEPARALSELRAGEVSCILAADGPGGALAGDLDAFEVGEDRLVLVGPPGGTDDPAPLAEALRGATLVVREAGRADRQATEALLRAAGVSVSDRVVVAGLAPALACVEAGLGMALLPGIALAAALRAGRVRAVPTAEPLPALRYSLVTRAGAAPDPVVAALIEALAAA